MFTQITRILGFAGLLLLCTGCDLEVIPDNFTGGGGGPNEGAPVACFTVSSTSCTLGDCNLAFDAQCSENETTYRWDFDNDGNFDVEGTGEITPSFNFTTAGTFMVKLEVQDDRSRTDDTIMVVEVNDLDILTFSEADPTLGAARGMQVLEDGSAVIAGGTGNDIYLRKVGSDGGTIFTETYTAPGRVTVRDLIVLNDETYGVAGHYTDPSTNDPETFFLRTSELGVAIGELRSVSQTSGHTMAGVIQLDDDNSLVFATNLTSGSSGSTHLTRMSSNLLTFFWTESMTASGISNVVSNDIEKTSDGFVIVGKESDFVGREEGFFARFDMEGNRFTGHPKYFTGNDNSLTSTTRVGTDNYLSVWQRDQFPRGVRLMLTDGDGVQVPGFSSDLESVNQQTGFGVRTTPDGGAIISGQDTTKVMLIKLNSEFNKEWSESVQFTGLSGFLHAAATGDGGYFACGFRASSLFYAKTDEEGKFE